MAKTLKAPKPPFCTTCDTDCRLTDGEEVYPHLPALHDKPIWKCDGCGDYVGCHPDTVEALGTPANAATRNARRKLHDLRFDPLWRTADKCDCYKPDSDAARLNIQRKARFRVYAFLAHRMNLTKDRCHISMFTIEQCREAWRALEGVDYPTIRKWHHRIVAETEARAAEKKAEKAAKAGDQLA